MIILRYSAIGRQARKPVDGVHRSIPNGSSTLAIVTPPSPYRYRVEVGIAELPSGGYSKKPTGRRHDVFGVLT